MWQFVQNETFITKYVSQRAPFPENPGKEAIFFGFWYCFCCSFVWSKINYSNWFFFLFCINTSLLSHETRVSTILQIIYWNTSDIIIFQNRIIKSDFKHITQISVYTRKLSFWKSVWYITYPQPAFTCSKLTIETLEKGVKHVRS